MAEADIVMIYCLKVGLDVLFGWTLELTLQCSL
jgi:hypothetical protein